MPELTIIVPVYKVESYLHRCIDSILAQTFTDFELILIDDGSPDLCGTICDEYTAKDNRIIVIHQENQGVSSARNAGLDIARGAYIGFVDSDDWIEPTMFENLVGSLKQYDVDISICGLNYYSNSGEFRKSSLTGDALLGRDQLLRALYGKPNPIGGGCVNKLFSKNVVEGVRFMSDIRMAEDWIFLFMCFRNASKAYHGKTAEYNVTERPDSATRLNETDAFYDLLFGGKSLLFLLQLAQEYSPELEKIAVDKYMDDCIRYSNIIRKNGRKAHQAYRIKFLRIRLQVLKQMPRAIFKKTLSKEKIFGYLHALILR